MQNLNYFLVVCAVATSVCVIPTVHAQDTDAQAKAREALRQKVSQLEGSAPAPQITDTEAQAKAREALRKNSTAVQPTVPPKNTTAVQPTVAPPAISKPPSTTVAQPAISTPPSTTVAPPAISPPPPSNTGIVTITMTPEVAPADAAAIEKARQAARQKLDEQNHGSPDSPEVAKAREAMRQQLAGTAQPKPVEGQVVQPAKPAQPANVEAVHATQNGEKAAHAQAEAQSKAEKAAQVEVEKSEAAAQAERRAKHNANLAPTAFQPIESPALPISNDKQQRLAELLTKYRADQITPEQYHLERAKILGEK